MISNESSPIQYLDFEAPIQKIQDQIDEMVAMEKKSNIDLSDKINILKENLEAEKLKVTQGLTTWQKVQLSRHPNRPYALFYMDNITYLQERLNLFSKTRLSVKPILDVKVWYEFNGFYNSLKSMLVL